MDKSYVKSVFHDLWDDYQLKVATQFGNNKFWTYMKDYNLEQKEIVLKYTSKPAQYYKKRLAALVQGKDFTEVAPPKNMEEALDRGKESAKVYAKKAEVGLISLGNTLD